MMKFMFIYTLFTLILTNLQVLFLLNLKLMTETKSTIKCNNEILCVIILILYGVKKTGNNGWLEIEKTNYTKKK